MLITEYAIAEIFTQLRRLAESLMRTLQSPEPDLEDADLKVHLLQSTFEELVPLLGGLRIESIQDFRRHLGFIRRDVRRFGEGNLKDIMYLDIPRLEQAHLEKLRSFPHLDRQLRDECRTLLLAADYSAVIQRAFHVLKARIVEKLGAPASIDGTQLIEHLLASITIDSDVRKVNAFKSFCYGLYGYFRNTFAHNLVSDAEHEAETVLASVNMILRLIEERSAAVR